VIHYHLEPGGCAQHARARSRSSNAGRFAFARGRDLSQDACRRLIT
jgi:hypothetical protein